MESHAFDRLTRQVATAPTRRRLLTGLLAGALGLIGQERTGAANCRAPGSVCREGGDCCSKVCKSKDARGRRHCGCRTAIDCPATNACQTAACQQGTCVSTPVVCPAPDVCHRTTCKAATGCVNTPLTGTPCDTGAACTTNDICQSGTCVGGAAVVCPTGQVCDPLLGCVCSTNEGCPAGRECFHGGCFLPNPSLRSQICFDVCGPSDLGLLGGHSVCIGPPTNTTCTSHADCPVGQACHDCPSPPCILSCLSPC
jgi:hypothetical protein